MLNCAIAMIAYTELNKKLRKAAKNLDTAWDTCLSRPQVKAKTKTKRG